MLILASLRAEESGRPRSSPPMASPPRPVPPASVRPGSSGACACSGRVPQLCG